MIVKDFTSLPPLPPVKGHLQTMYVTVSVLVGFREALK